MHITFVGITTKMIEIAVEDTNPFQNEMVPNGYDDPIKDTKEL